MRRFMKRDAHKKEPEFGVKQSHSSKEGSGFYIGHGRRNFVYNLDVFAERESLAIHNRFSALREIIQVLLRHSLDSSLDGCKGLA